MPEMSGTVTEWLKPGQPLALWWQRNYPGLRHVSRELAARVRAACAPGAPGASGMPGIPVDTPGLRYYDYGLLGGAIDYRMRMEFTRQWGGDPMRNAFTRAWAGKTGKRGSLAHAAAGLLADCAPVLAQAGPRAAHLAESLPALADLLEEHAARLDELAPWDWTGSYATSQREESWLLDYCLVLAELDNFYRSWSARFDFTPLLSPSGYRSVLYASGRSSRTGFWGAGSDNSHSHSHSHSSHSGVVDGSSAARQHEAAARIVSELGSSWALFAYLCRTPSPTLEGLASVACGPGKLEGPGGKGGPGGLGKLPLLRRDLAAQLALWNQNPARQSAQPPRVITANPTFAGSTRLPADGDLIVRSKEGSGFLIDFKSAKRIEPAGMLTVLRQILTYALMDEQDEYEITRVGFYFTRYGVWAHWDLQELLDRNIGVATGGAGAIGQSQTVDSHRQALRRMLLDLRQPQALDVATPRR